MTNTDTVKQVILLRTDLAARKGKLAAQASHASLRVFLDRRYLVGDNLVIPLTKDMQVWVEGHYTKIVLGVASEDLLLRAHELALEAGIPCALVTDLGFTEFHGVPTKTALAIGPAKASRIDPITGPSGAIPTKLL